MDFIKSARGSAMAMAIVALAAAVGGSYYVLNQMGSLSKDSVGQVKMVKISPLKDKLSRLGGFLIASNLLICRSNSWMDGGAKGTCRWNSKNYAGSSESYSPESFHLKNRGLVKKDYLQFDLNIFNIFPKQKKKKLLTGKNSWVKFKLIKSDDLSKNIIKLTSAEAQNDKDFYLVMMEGRIEYRSTDGKVKFDKFRAAFRRPIAIPEVEVTSTSCAQRCDVSLTENPNPACRSSFYIDKETMTDVSATTTNLGPGSVYDLVYERKTAYKSGSALQESAQKPMPVDINIDDYLIPGGKKIWADNFPCATISQSKSENKTVEFNFFKYIHKVASLPFTLLIPEANAQYVKVKTGSSTTTSLSQHSNPAGTVIYEVGGGANSTIEPFRMTAPINPTPKEFSGLMNTTTTTNFYTWIYFDPPH